MNKSAKLMAILSAAVLFAAASPSGAQNRPASRPVNLIRLNGGKFIYGVDYYPEAWSEARWTKDAQMMQAAGINFVRMGEFAWAKMEPKEGEFDFSWLDRALRILGAHGIRAILGTPTAAPPPWLYAEYPDIEAVNKEGVRYRFGSRRDYSLENPHFLAAARSVVTALAEHYKNNPDVLGFQIDNEVGSPRCYDSDCLAAFHAWCRAKYGTLAALNHDWGTIFWGQTYSAWSQIPLPWNTLYGVSNPSLWLDYDRFFSDATSDYVKMQADILRRIAPSKALTTNEMGLFDAIDYSELNRQIDFVAWDNYPMLAQDPKDYFAPGLAHDLMRGSKDNQNFMVMEEEGGLPGWSTFWSRQVPAMDYRLWAYQAIAHGADGVSFFRWRTSRYGTEQYWQGILDQDGVANSRYKVVARMGSELPKLTPLLEGTHVISPVALLVSPDSRWAFHIQPLVKGFNYDGQLALFYDAFRRKGINVDVIFPSDDFSSYKVLVAPSLFVVNPVLVSKLTRFVSSGGTLILTYRSGVKNQYNVVTKETLPGALSRLAGTEIHEFDPETTQQQTIVDRDGGIYPATVWHDILSPTTASVLAHYGEDFYAMRPAMTLNGFGKGHVIYLGTQSSSATFYDRLTGFADGLAGVHRGPVLPKGVEMSVRQRPGEKLIFLLNYTNQPQTVSLDEATRDAFSGDPQKREVKISPINLRILIAP